MHSMERTYKCMLSLKNKSVRYWMWHSKACNDTDHKAVALLKA